MRHYEEYKNVLMHVYGAHLFCNHCASSCTQEEDVKMMAACIQLDMECSAICYAAAQLMSLGSNKAKDVCRICAEICQACANECSKHESEPL
jgi:hypothetical protein